MSTKWNGAHNTSPGVQIVADWEMSAKWNTGGRAARTVIVAYWEMSTDWNVVAAVPIFNSLWLIGK